MRAGRVSRLGLFILALVTSLSGYLIIFVLPLYDAGLTIPLGILLATLGTFLLIYVMAAFFNRLYEAEAHQKNMDLVYKTYRASIGPALAGGIPFGLLSLLLPKLISPPQILSLTAPSSVFVSVAEFVLVGVFVGFCVSYYMIRYFDRLPFRNPLTKAVFLSLIALLIISIIETFLHAENLSYFIISILYNAPRFLVLGVSMGMYFRTFKPSVNLTQIVRA